MKKTHALILFSLFSFGVAMSSFLRPVNRVIENELTIKTVNGGNAEYIAQQTYFDINFTFFWLAISFLSVILAILVKNTNKNTNK